MAQESRNLDKEEAEILKPSSTPPPTPPPLISISSSPPPSLLSSPPPPPLFLNSPKLKRPDRPETPTEDPRPPRARVGNRCLTCRKRVRLTGFRCRCGDLFCIRHRYSDIHDCPFDYKGMGREEISKANPVVRAAKIIKI